MQALAGFRFNFAARFRVRLTLLAVVFCLGSFVVPSGKASAQVPTVPKDTLPDELDLEHIPVGYDVRPIPPEDNPITKEKAALGRKLFFDPILSINKTVACASCHRPENAFASPDARAIGIDGGQGTRNAPTILNAAYSTSLTWDGRDETLEQQVLGPLTNKLELGDDIEAIIARLKKDDTYSAEFANAFDVEPDKAVTIDHVAKAIATFERVLVSGDNGVDRFRRREYKSLSKSARTGMWIFESRGGCWKCHSGDGMTDDLFHNTGVSFGSEDRDLGRMGVTKDAAHRFQFRTQSLRNIELTAPYMHDGSIKTLREVVEFYNRGGSPDDPHLDKKLKPLGLTDEEVGYLVDFLKALTSESLKKESQQAK